MFLLYNLKTSLFLQLKVFVVFISSYFFNKKICFKPPTHPRGKKLENYLCLREPILFNDFCSQK